METGLTPIFLKTGERDVLNNIMLGLTDRQISEKIHMSLGCIKDNEEIRKKLAGGV